MPDLYRLQVLSIRDKYLTCRVTELYDEAGLCPSPTLVLHFLWDTVDGRTSVRCPTDETDILTELAPDFAQSSPLGQALAGRYAYEDGEWNWRNAGRFVSCVGIVDRCVATTVDDYFVSERGWHRTPVESRASQATFHIGVTDSQWLEHLAPGMEWESRGYPEDTYIPLFADWLTPDVMLLAKNLDETGDFSGLPVLADALQEAWCDSDELLNHLRDPNATHVRGRWALDLILGKE